MSSRSCCIQVGQMLDRSYPRDMTTEAIANLTMVERATAEKIQEAFPEYRFNNLSILLQAFTAKSYTRNFKSSVGNNERMEFFGDTILSFIVTNHLFETYYVSEGILTELKQTLCSNKTLCTVGRNLYLDKHIRRSKGENQHGNPTEDQI